MEEDDVEAGGTSMTVDSLLTIKGAPTLFAFHLVSIDPHFDRGCVFPTTAGGQRA